MIVEKTAMSSATRFLLSLVALCSLLLCIILTSGCQSGSTGESVEKPTGAESSLSEPVTFTDDTGAQVTVNNPQRVVACMGSFANIWELAGGTLVGVSDDALTSYAITSPDVQTVGDFSKINLESIIALEPDFVIMTSGSGGRASDSSQLVFRDSLEASGIPVAYFEVSSFEDYLRMLRVCCDITGRDDLYEQNGTAVQERIDSIVAQVPGDKQPTALFMATYSGGARVQSSSSMVGGMAAQLGVRNLADENPSLLSDFSIEAVIEMNPDFIFVIPMGNDEAAAAAALEKMTVDNPAWSELDCVKNGRSILLDAQHFLYKPNNVWDESYTILYNNLYVYHE